MRTPRKNILFVEFQEKTSALHLLPIIKGLANNPNYSLYLLGQTDSYLAKTAPKLGVKTYTYKYVEFNIHNRYTYKPFLRLLWLMFKVVLENRINLIHSHRLNWAYFCIVYSYIFRIPLLVDIVFFEKLTSRLQNFLVKHDKKSVYLAITQNIRNRFHQHYNIPKSRIFVFCGGIASPVKRVPKAVLPVSARGKRVVAMISRFAPSKGVEVFIEAAGILMNKFKDVHFMFVGHQKDIVWGENYYERCLTRIKNLGLSKKFTIVDFKYNMEDYYPHFYCTVLPTEMDALGYVLIESMAYKKPVVVTEVDGTPEAVNFGKAGILVPYPPSPVLFAKEVEKLLVNKKHYQNYAESGYDWFMSRFNIDTNINKLKKIYNRARF